MYLRNCVQESESKPFDQNTHKPLPQGTELSNFKFNLAMERQIEKIFGDAQKHGWSYQDFTLNIVEVLLILQRREKVNQAVQFRQEQ